MSECHLEGQLQLTVQATRSISVNLGQPYCLMQRKWGDFLDSAAYSTSGSREIHMHEREAAFENRGGWEAPDRTGRGQ